MSAATTRKTVTVLFCDVTGSTELGERLDPETLRSVMLRYFDAAREVLERHGGTVEKFIGDAVMAIFGVPAVHEDDALRAIRAAAAILERLEDLNEELEQAWDDVRLEARIGISSGEVVAGAGGTLVTGDTVNVAARLQQSAEPGQILVGNGTYRLVAHAVQAVPLDERSLKGKAAPVAPWLVEHVAAEAPTLATRPDSPLVGRDWELEFLRRAFDRAVTDSRCEVVTVIAPAGVGKTRLAHELTSQLDEATIAVGRCLAYGDGITFWPVRDVVRTLAGILPGDAPAEAHRKIEDLAGDCEDAALICERVAEAIGLGDGGMAAAPEVFWALRRLFESVAARRPLVLVLEDIHWAEPTLLDLLESVAQWSSGAPILLLCLARPELLDVRPPWGELSALLALDPLGDDETRALIGNLLGTRATPEVVGRLVQAAEGNPLFVEELVGMLIDEGSFDVDRLDVPPTIQALLAARLDRLDPPERAVIERAAVVGKQFWWSAVEALAPADLRPSVPATLHALLRKKLIRPETAAPVAGENAFRFGHILIRDAAYGALPKVLRADLHEQFAAWLQEVSGERVGEYEEILGYHLEQAYRARAELGLVDSATRALAERAAAVLGAAGRRAFARDDMPAAVALLDRAVALANDEDPARLELVRELSVALWSVGEIARAELLLDGLIDAAVTAADTRQQWYGILERVSRRELTDPGATPNELLAVAQHAVEVFQELGDDVGLARAWRRVYIAHHRRCRFHAGQEASERGLEHARRAGDAQYVSRNVDGLCTCLLYGPEDAARAITRCEQMLGEAAGNPLMEANVLASLAGLLAMRDRIDEARAATARAEAIYGELGLRFAVAGLMQVLGEAERTAGELREAERALRRGYEILEGLGGAGYTAALLGEVVYAQGRFEDARELVAMAHRGAGRDVSEQVVLRSLLARLRARLGEDEAAVDEARDAVALAAETDALNLHANALVALAEVATLGGHVVDTSTALRRALELYAEKGNVAAAARTAALEAHLVS